MFWRKHFCSSSVQVSFRWLFLFIFGFRSLFLFVSRWSYTFNNSHLQKSYKLLILPCAFWIHVKLTATPLSHTHGEPTWKLERNSVWHFWNLFSHFERIKTDFAFYCHPSGYGATCHQIKIELVPKYSLFAVVNALVDLILTLILRAVPFICHSFVRLFGLITVNCTVYFRLFLK